jgi:hypothetical protein
MSVQTQIDRIGGEVSEQADLIRQIKTALAGKAVVGAEKIDSVRFEGIENEHVSRICRISLIVYNDGSAPLVDTDDFDSVVVMIFCEHVLRIENVHERF